jgi:hypothetical protein
MHIELKGEGCGSQAINRFIKSHFNLKILKLQIFITFIHYLFLFAHAQNEGWR